MNLMRIGAAGAEKPAARIDDETYVDVSDVVDDFDEALLRRWRARRTPRRWCAERAAPGRCRRVRRTSASGAPIARPHQILCIGLNYSDHAAETGQAVPDEPILFTKSPNTLVGPYDDVRIPRGSTKTDWEVELGIVIGRRTSLPRLGRGRPATRSPATCSSTTSASARSRWSAAGSGRKGKSAETFNPAGPVAGHPGRDRRRLGTGHVARRQRRPPADRLHRDDGLRPVLHRALPQPVHGPRARRPDRHRNASRRRAWASTRRSGCSRAT